MRATIDPSVNMGYLYLTDNIGPGECFKSIQVHFDKNSVKGMIMPDLIIDLDKDGRVVGIEFFDAKNQMPQELIDQAEDIT